jgi:hypothetical protein
VVKKQSMMRKNIKAEYQGSTSQQPDANHKTANGRR